MDARGLAGAVLLVLLPAGWFFYEFMEVPVSPWHLLLAPVAALLGGGTLAFRRRHARRRQALDAYRRGTGEALAESRAMMEAQLARLAKDPKVSPADIAEFRRVFGQVDQRTADDAKRREQVYAANPALIEDDLRKTIEEIRAKQRRS
jgi:hypothetical protein